jgi:hypothetical protein
MVRKAEPDVTAWLMSMVAWVPAEFAPSSCTQRTTTT